MGLTKENNYSINDINLSQIGMAFGHPARKRIVEHLIVYGYTTNSDLPRILNLSQPAVSHHLEIMLRANVIRNIYHIHYNEIVLVPETLKMYSDYVESINRKIQMQ